MASSPPKDQSLLIFQKYLPPAAVPYCYKIWQEYKFKFLITKKRATKLGDYRFHIQKGFHTITVNGDLNPYAFLVTYLHEVAHMSANLAHGTSIQPHGQEWKAHFSDLLSPILNTQVLPNNVLTVLKNYSQNPKASSCADHDLLQALRTHDTQEHHLIQLSELPIGAKFVLTGRVFTKGELRRTRFMCLELKSNKRYVISAMAMVEMI